MEKLEYFLQRAHVSPLYLKQIFALWALRTVQTPPGGRSIINKINTDLENTFERTLQDSKFDLPEIGRQLTKTARTANGFTTPKVMKPKSPSVGGADVQNKTWAQKVTTDDGSLKQAGPNQEEKNGGNNDSSQICIYNWKGKCEKGKQCKYIHCLPESHKGKCFNFKNGTCPNVLSEDNDKFGLKQGTVICKYKHKLPESSGIQANVVTGDNDPTDDSHNQDVIRDVVGSDDYWEMDGVFGE